MLQSMTWYQLSVCSRVQQVLLCDTGIQDCTYFMTYAPPSLRQGTKKNKQKTNRNRVQSLHQHKEEQTDSYDSLYLHNRVSNKYKLRSDNSLNIWYGAMYLYSTGGLSASPFLSPLTFLEVFVSMGVLLVTPLKLPD